MVSGDAAFGSDMETGFNVSQHRVRVKVRLFLLWNPVVGCNDCQSEMLSPVSCLAMGLVWSVSVFYNE